MEKVRGKSTLLPSKLPVLGNEAKVMIGEEHECKTGYEKDI